MIKLKDQEKYRSAEKEFVAAIRDMCSERQQKYLDISQNYFLRMYRDVDRLFRGGLSGMRQLRVLEVGPFLPYTVALVEAMRRVHGMEILLDVIDMPLDPESKLPANIGSAVHQYIAGNIEKDCFGEHHGKYDLIFFTSVLEHLVVHPYGAMCEIYNLMAPMGWLFISVPNAMTIVNLYKYLCGENIHDHYSMESPYGRHNREYTISEIEQLFAYLNMAVVSIRPVKFDPIARRNPWRTLIFDILYRVKPSVGTDIFAIGRKGGVHIPPNEIPPSWWYRDTPGLMTTFR